jgi:hypothetical protein
LASREKKIARQVMNNRSPSIEDIKLAYRIPAAWRDLQLDGEAGKCVCSPFRVEPNPSFSIFEDGRKWKDFATGEVGDVVDFVSRAKETDKGGALRWIRQRLGIVDEDTDRKQTASKRRVPELRFASPDELLALSAHRNFGTDALHLAEARGLLRFCTFAGLTAWCVTDKRRQLYEFRRLDGAPWPAYKHLPERKCHCVGAGKRWPIGTLEATAFDSCALVEGAPDLLALFSFIVFEGKEDKIAPLAVLGAANDKLDDEAIRHLAGKRIRLFPHLDAAGTQAARAWARQLADTGCTVDAFDLSDCIRTDGAAGKDLADVCRISPDCWRGETKFHQILP